MVFIGWFMIEVFRFPLVVRHTGRTPFSYFLWVQSFALQLNKHSGLSTFSFLWFLVLTHPWVVVVWMLGFVLVCLVSFYLLVVVCYAPRGLPSSSAMVAGWCEVVLMPSLRRSFSSWIFAWSRIWLIKDCLRVLLVVRVWSTRFCLWYSQSGRFGSHAGFSQLSKVFRVFIFMIEW